ncbi:MAG TPA: pilus assembly protein TadG-related protein, partial [Woeseiaceae bacterium]|nr:pilus assembly protein TadG-related protein [Woeseiaceae bacterium]
MYLAALNLVKRLHREESAQISFLAVAGVICFVGLLSMVINTNDVVTERVHMQDVADATVLSAASWTARGLNTISFVNVLNTKLISTAVLLNALADSIPVMEAVGQIQQAIFSGCSGVP